MVQFVVLVVDVTVVELYTVVQFVKCVVLLDVLLFVDVLLLAAVRCRGRGRANQNTWGKRKSCCGAVLFRT